MTSEKVLGTVMACSLVYAPGVALADDVGTAVVEEIIVTTQKRSENIRTVPLSVSSISGSLLDTLGTNGFAEVSDLTPGLVVQEQSANNPAFVIRGITSDSGAPQIAPRVSIYLNGIDVSRSRGSYFELFDIERIEVVKGPQATLFGTAAAIGAVSVITRKPQEELAGELSLAYGNYDAQEARGFITGGSSKLQGRFAFSYRKRDGYVKNIAGSQASQSAGGTVQDDLNGMERFATRGSIRFTPNDTFIADLVLNYERDTDTGTSFKSGTFAPTGGDADPFSFAELGGAGLLSKQVLGREKLGVDRDLYDANLTMEWALSDTWSLTSQSGYREFESLEVFDADGSQAVFAEFAENARGDQFSQEIRANYSGQSITAFVGINYFAEDGRVAIPFFTEEGTFLQCAAGVIPGLPCVAASGSIGSLTTAQGLPPIYYSAEFGNTAKNRTYSSFADATIALNERLSFTSGLRYVHESRETGGFAALPTATLTGAPLLTFGNVDTGGNVVTAKASYDAVLPRFAVRYELGDQTNAYANVSKGRRSDVIEVASAIGLSGQPVAVPTFVPAEITWNYEAGVKSRLMDGKLDVAASIFYQTYESFQVTIREEGGVTRQSNAGSAKNIGVEGEFQAVVGEHTHLFGSIAYIDASIDDKAENGLFAGNRFRLQPDWSAAFGIAIDIPLNAELRLIGNATWTYKSDVFFEIENQPIAGLDIAENDVHSVGMNIGVASSSNTWEVKAFATNLFNNHYIIDAGNTGGLFGSPTFIAGPPRLYGLKLTTRF